MTPTQQRDQSIAEAVGYAVIDYLKSKGPYPTDRPVLWRDADGNLHKEIDGVWGRFSPSTSRDDCAELLGKLTDEQWEKTQWALVSMLRPQLCTLKFWLTATPAQIAESVWRATCQS